MTFINSLISSMSLKFPAMIGVEFLQEPSSCEAAQIERTAKIQEQFVPRKKEKSICSQKVNLTKRHWRLNVMIFMTTCICKLFHKGFKTIQPKIHQRNAARVRLIDIFFYIWPLTALIRKNGWMVNESLLVRSIWNSKHDHSSHKQLGVNPLILVMIFNIIFSSVMSFKHSSFVQGIGWKRLHDHSHI